MVSFLFFHTSFEKEEELNCSDASLYFDRDPRSGSRLGAAKRCDFRNLVKAEIFFQRTGKAGGA